MITSLVNEKVKNLVKLQQKKYRDEQNAFVVEGFHLVDEAKKANLLIELFTTNDQIEGTLVSRDVLRKVSTTETPQEVIAIVRKPQVDNLGDKVLVLDNVQDPGNVGTLIRTAKSFGFDTVLVKGADPFAPKVVRASQGALFHINVVQTNDLASHFGNHLLVGALLDEKALNYKEFQVPNKMMLILGNEGQGISPEIVQKLDAKVYIPILFESLNVAVAGGILMNEYKK